MTDVSNLAQLHSTNKQTNRTDVVQLIEQFQNNPKETKKKTLGNQLNLKGKNIKYKI